MTLENRMELVGQPRIVSALRQALHKGRLPHALLFLGPSGVGRETAARGLAAGLLCEQRDVAPVLPFGCGQCRGCRRVAAGTHPDVHVVLSPAEGERRGVREPEGKKASLNIGADAARALIGQLHLSSYEGGARVAIVVDAHRLTVEAQNALLKTLEEPRPGTVLILIAPNTRSLLTTIASRCLRLTFSPLATEEVAALLLARGFVADEALHRATLADGSVGRALALDPKAAPPAGAQELLDSLCSPDATAQKRLDAAEGLGRDRADVDQALALVERSLAAAARLAAGVRGPGLAAELTPHQLSVGDAANLLDAVNATRRAIAENAQVQLALERLVLDPNTPR